MWVDPLGWAPWIKGKFNEWFDAASSKAILDNKESVSRALRGGMGMHEKFPVAIAWKAKELGFTAQESKDMTIPTKDITFIGISNNGINIPDGTHHSSSASSLFHNQLIEELLNSNSKDAAIKVVKNLHQKHAINYQGLSGGCK